MRSIAALLLVPVFASAQPRVLPALSRPSAPALTLRVPAAAASASSALRFAAPTLTAGPALAPALTPSGLSAPALAPALVPAAPPVPVAHAKTKDDSGLKRLPAAAIAPNALGALYDGSRSAANEEAMRPTNPWEDHRIGRAVAALNRSAVGRDVYAAVYRDWGSQLRMEVDDAASANYDARLEWREGRPVLKLTESLLRRSDEAIGAYIVRELSDLYYRGVPSSAERGYLSYGAMIQTFAETARAWEPDFQRYYGSWKEAVKGVNSGAYAELSDAPFFRDFLMTIDDSNTEARAKLSLRQQLDRGYITWSEYKQYRAYARTMTTSYVNWLVNKGYWN